jgi:hypothetical protein
MAAHANRLPTDKKTKQNKNNRQINPSERKYLYKLSGGQIFIKI